MNKQIFNQRRAAIQEQSYEQIEKKRESRLLLKPKMNAGDNVEASMRISTDIQGLHIEVGTKGEIVRVGKWLDVYSVNFSVHGLNINVWCIADAIKKN